MRQASLTPTRYFGAANLAGALSLITLAAFVLAGCADASADTLATLHGTPVFMPYVPARSLTPTGAPEPSPTPVPTATSDPRPTGLPPTTVPPNTARPWHSISNWTYWLSNPDLDAIAASHFQLAVIDYSRDGSAEGVFTNEEISSLRGGTCRRRILAYLSIGEAEEYRSYWQPGWGPDSPSWLATEDPDWPGNFYVRYWDPAWQAIVYAYLDQILASGYDGVYLDRPDAFTQSYAAGHEQDMVDFVIAIAQYARQRSPLGSDFGIFPQNAEELGNHPEYLSAVTGLGIEELYYAATGVKVANADRLYREQDVDRFKQKSSGQLILAVDYANQTTQIAEAYQRAGTKGYAEYVTVVDLDRMRINPTFEPACDP